MASGPSKTGTSEKDSMELLDDEAVGADAGGRHPSMTADDSEGEERLLREVRLVE